MKRMVQASSVLKRKKMAGVVLLLCVATALALPAQTFTLLHTFDGTDGANPVAALIQATNGYLYGTASRGGAAVGTVFKITSAGALTTLHNFCQGQCTDGSNPEGALVQVNNGDLYGTTFGGSVGDGIVFKITPSGTLTTVYTLSLADGNLPNGALVQATKGDLYGAAGEGGLNNRGAIFKITQGGTWTTLYSFCPQSLCPDGDSPQGGLIQATNGELYGTTGGGGANGRGTIFKITPSGTFTTVYSFCPQSGCLDGDSPEAGLVQARDGALYGTTLYGGSAGDGTVFRMTPGGAITTLYSFSGTTDGSFPGGLVQATDGDFYG
jgi:uncharacterized repeat protein (TIGR03803 family)